VSRAQIDACAARLQPADAAQFRALLMASAALFGQAVQLRRQAWDIYRQAVPLEQRRKSTIARTKSRP
jgi:hypothetical protein